MSGYELRGTERRCEALLAVLNCRLLLSRRIYMDPGCHSQRFWQVRSGVREDLNTRIKRVTVDSRGPREG